MNYAPDELKTIKVKRPGDSYSYWAFDLIRKKDALYRLISDLIALLRKNDVDAAKDLFEKKKDILYKHDFFHLDKNKRDLYRKKIEKALEDPSRENIDELEVYGTQLKEVIVDNTLRPRVFLASYIRHISYLIYEAGLKDWIKKVISKIPGLPSKDEALKIVSKFMQESPEKFSKVVDEIYEMMKNIPVAGLTAFDIKNLLSNIKTVTNPKIILAIIALMDILQTTDTNEIIQYVKQNMRIGIN